MPLFAGVFLFVLFSNWSGLLPFVGKVEFLRAPTSDVNVTLGLALVSFVIFESEGFRRLGVRGYLGKFFSLRAFKEGPAAGFIALYVGFIEFMLEFIKPVTLAMRLFGNIFGGELAIGVITALTIAVVPVALLGLEVLLNFVQALIFSVLTLMYTLIAIESHDEEEHAAPAFADDPEGNLGRPLAGMEPAAHHDLAPTPSTTSIPALIRAPARTTQEENQHMEHIGAGLAALGVIGPGIGIGILTGLSTAAIGRNPEATASIRASSFLGAAFAEGLGVLAIVVGILAIDPRE